MDAAVTNGGGNPRLHRRRRHHQEGYQHCAALRQHPLHRESHRRRAAGGSRGFHLLHAHLHRRLPPGEQHRVHVDTTKAMTRASSIPAPPTTAPRASRRVTIETVGGEPFDANATYTIATNDFMAAGGDTYYAFAAASVNYDLGLSMDEVVMDYITDELKGHRHRRGLRSARWPHHCLTRAWPSPTWRRPLPTMTALSGPWTRASPTAPPPPPSLPTRTAPVPESSHHLVGAPPVSPGPASTETRL